MPAFLTLVNLRKQGIFERKIAIYSSVATGVEWPAKTLIESLHE